MLVTEWAHYNLPHCRGDLTSESHEKKKLFYAKHPCRAGEANNHPLFRKLTPTTSTQVYLGQARNRVITITASETSLVLPYRVLFQVENENIAREWV